MVLRALGGPVVLLTSTVMLTAIVVVAAPEDAPVAVDEAALVDKLSAVDIAAEHVSEPLVALEAGTHDRAVVRDGAGGGEDFVIHHRPAGWQRWSARRGHQDLLLEAVVREHALAGWRLEVASRPGIGRALPGHVRTLLQLLGLLFTLYAVVLVVAAAVRDREDGTLEALGATAMPSWVTPLSRGLAVVLAVGGLLAGSQLILAALFGLTDVAGVLMSSQVAVVAAAAVGTAAPAGQRWGPVGPFTGAPDGLSVPLSRGLVATMSLAALGYTLPAVGGWLPIGGMVAPAPPRLALVSGAVFALLLGIGSVWRAGRARW